MYPPEVSHRLAKVARRVPLDVRARWYRAVLSYEERGVTRLEQLPRWVREGTSPGSSV